MELLIPGLLDDLAYQCLLRLPYFDLKRLCVISRAWNSALSNPDFFRKRRENHLDKPLLCALVSDFRFHNELRVYDPENDVWYRAPPLPVTPQSTAVGFRCEIVDGGRKLALCGGWRWETLNTLTFFDFWTRKWIEGSPMHTPRAHFATGMINDKLIAACGMTDNDSKSNTAELYDSATGLWEELTPAPENLSFCESLVISNRLYTRARGGNPSPTLVFGDGAWGVESTSRLFQLPWRFPMTSLKNLVFRIEDGERLMVYDPVRNQWEPVDFSGDLSEVCFKQLVSDERGNRLWAISDGFCIATVEVEDQKARLVKLSNYQLGSDGSNRNVLSAHVFYV